MNEQLLKSLNGAIDAAIKELATIDALSKSDVSLQDAKLRPESSNGSLPGHDGGAVSDSALKPEDAKKAEEAAKGDLKVMHEDGCDDDKAKKGENPFADKKDDDKDDKKKDDDKDDDDDMDDEKAEKLKAKIKKYEAEKAAKAMTAGAPASMTKSEIDAVADTLQKSLVSKVEELTKSITERLAQVEDMMSKLAKAPQPRQSVSGLAPLAKSEDAQPAQTLSKGEVLDKLFEMQKSGDSRVDSDVIIRVDMNDFSVLAERGINLK